MTTYHSLEILLGNHSFCNLVTIAVDKFNGDFEGLREAANLIARANYRQTCVNLKDGVLQNVWHELNEHLRLLGVSLTGIAQWEHKNDIEKIQAVYRSAGRGGDSMASELNLPKPKAITTIKPEGTLSGVLETTQGITTPDGRYIFNNVRFSKSDTNVTKLRKAGYRVFEDPTSSDAFLVTLPLTYPNVEFKGGGDFNVNETAIDQLERYKLFMENYVEHNASITVYYDPSEIPAIAGWLHTNWDSVVGISFLLRNDITKTAADLGYSYLPQEVVTKEAYESYVSGLKDVRLGNKADDDGQAQSTNVDAVEACATGACPIR